MASAVALSLEDGRFAEQLEQALAELEQTLRKGNQAVIVSSSHNVFLTALDGLSGGKDEDGDSLELLSRALPGRHFVVVRDSASEAVTVELQECKLDSGESLASVVIRLNREHLSLPALLSIFRSLRISGAETFFFLGEPEVTDALLSGDDMRGSRGIVIDSLEDVWTEESLFRLCSFEAELVDFVWIESSSWREFIKRALGHPASRIKPSSISKIEVSYGACEKKGFRWDVALICGWLTLSLDWESVAATVKGIEFRDLHTGAARALHFTETASGEVGVSSIRLYSDNGEELVLERKGGICDVVLQCAANARYQESFHSGVKLESLARYFTVGESTLNYKHAARRGVEVLQLRRGYAA